MIIKANRDQSQYLKIADFPQRLKNDSNFI